MDGEASFYQSLCHNYQAKLKTKAQNVSESSWIQSRALLFNKQSPGLSYTPVVLCIKETDSPSMIKNPRSKKRKIDRKHVKTYRPENQQEISVSDLLKHDKKKIILIGAAGSGKTVVVHRMLKLWAESEDKNIKYMFYFDMRETSHDVMTMSLEDLLFSVFSEPDEGRDEVLQDIKTNSDRVVIIFDGLTDLPSSSVVGELIHMNLLPQSKIIIACRPEVESADFLSDWDPLRVEVKGFSEQSIREYLSKNLSEQHMNNVFSNIKVFSLCHTPVYALMVVAFFSFEGSEHLPQPCTLTEIYLNILHFCIQRSSNTTYERDVIASLAEAAFLATQSQTEFLTSLTCEDSCVHSSFLKTFEVQVTRGVWKTSTAFKHSTLQEFFAALWLLMNPERIRGFIQHWTTDRLTHVKHLILFMCGLLNERNTDVLESLILASYISDLKTDLKEVLIKFIEFHQKDRHTEDLLFLCQCLYESQSPEVCLFLLDKLGYCLDVRGGTLDSLHCFALSYIISQSKEKKIQLYLDAVTVSEEGSKLLVNCLGNVQRCDSSLLQLWTISLLNEWEVNYTCLLDLAGNQLHLPVRGERRLFEAAVKMLQRTTEKIKVCLHRSSRGPVCPHLSKLILQCLEYIHSLSFKKTHKAGSSQERKHSCETLAREEKQLLLDLWLKAIRREVFPSVMDTLLFLFNAFNEKHDILLELYQHAKTQGILSVIPMLKPLFQSAPAVWSINLSEGKSSILLEVLKLQSEKKEVKLISCSHEKSEVRSFLDCLLYISQLSFCHQTSQLSNQTRFFMNLFCAAAERKQQTEEKTLELLSSVCSYETFPVKDLYNMDDYCSYIRYQCDFLLHLCSRVKVYETKTGLSVLPLMQSVFWSAPVAWFIDTSDKKITILPKMLNLQPEKKEMKLTGFTCKKSNVRSFLQCLPYISQLSVDDETSDEAVRFFVNLFCAAAQREQQTGEKIPELLSSVCRYKNSPLKEKWCDFLMDLYSYEAKTGLSVLPSLQSVFQSAPAVWSINLIYTDFSILLEVLKLQPEKKQVELREWPEEEEEDSVLRSFLQCLPYISQLSCEPDFFQSVCTSMSVRSREEAQQLESLLQLLGFQLLLTGELHRKSCWSVGRVLRLCGSKVDLILTPSKMSVRGAALLFRHTTQLHSLRLSIDMSLLLFQWVRRGRVVCPLAVEELSLVPKKARPSHRVMLRAVSSLASLLRHWTVGRLDLTESCIPAQGLITLLLHDGPLTVKLSEESFQQLLCLLHEIQDKDLTLSFLSKVGGDLTSCCLNWELLHYLLQQASAQTITVNLRKNLFLQEETTRLLPFLDRIVFKRPSPSFVMSSIRELYRAHDSHAVPSLLRSLGHVINLSCRELDSVDCAALIFILKHGDRVKLNLLWTSIPAEGAESILFMLDNVSHLSVDRNQLLRFIHCCAACDVQQEAASGLLRSLQHSLDLSCSSCVELPEEDQPEPLSLTADDCRAVSTILTHSSRDTQLDLRDCEVEDSMLDLLFPVLHRVHLRVSKTVLLQLLSLVPVNSERDTVRRAVSLCRALGGELDLSHSTLDQRVCGSLVQMLDSCEGLTELDLSHCQLTDQLLLPLITHLHKVQVLDLSHNQITDASTDVLLQLLSINPSIDCVRLYSNNIVHRAAFKEHKQFEIW